MTLERKFKIFYSLIILLCLSSICYAFFVEYILSYKPCILCKFQNKSLAEKIWGVKDDGETWECMYFFKEIKEISIDIKEFNKLLSYGEENKIFKFRVLDENRSNLLIQHFKL